MLYIAWSYAVELFNQDMTFLICGCVHSFLYSLLLMNTHMYVTNDYLATTSSITMHSRDIRGACTCVKPWVCICVTSVGVVL